MPCHVDLKTLHRGIKTLLDDGHQGTTVACYDDNVQFTA